MISISSADKALKTLYLGVISEQMNTTINPLLSKIKQSTSNVWGKEIKKLAHYGINGGIGAGSETGSLPAVGGNSYEQFTLSLKNLYGRIEISDKAMRASDNSTGAFVNLLNAEMEGLLKASKFNFGRMLFGDGSGVLGVVIETGASNVISVTNCYNYTEGLIVDFRDYSTGNIISGLGARKITAVDRINNTITVDGTTISSATLVEDSLITVQNSYNQEITGLGAIFKTSGSLYGLSRDTHKWLKPCSTNANGSITETLVSKMIDDIEDSSGSKTNFIICSSGVRRALAEELTTYRRSYDMLNLEGGFKALSFNGIPVVSDRFCPKNTMYLLNTDDFVLHQLCDWKWLEGEDGRVLKQIAGTATYTATLVKYADLICSRPCAQGVITGITEA